MNCGAFQYGLMNNSMVDVPTARKRRQDKLYAAQEDLAKGG
jgi:hypothetical protein